MKSGARICAGALVAALSLSAADAADLYQAETFAPLTSDRRAAKVGDILTVVVFEASSAQNTAETSSDKSVGVNAQLRTARGRVEGAELSVGDDFQGGGRLEKSGRLLAQISVTVEAVLPSGDLIVKGEQEIDVNGERTQIRLQGRVRPRDVAGNNTVLSNRLADAKIEYLGDGHISDRSKPGWITKILTWLGIW